MLPTSASARQVGDQLRTDFADNLATNVTVVIPDADGISTAEMDGYAAQLSAGARVYRRCRRRLAHSSPVRLSGPPSAATDRQRRQRVSDRHEQRAAVLAGLETQLD